MTASSTSAVDGYSGTGTGDCWANTADSVIGPFMMIMGEVTEPV